MGKIEDESIKKAPLAVWESRPSDRRQDTLPHFIPQPIQRPATERLAAEPRWSWENSTETAIERMEMEQYAYLNTLQSIYSQLGKARSSSDFFQNDNFR